MDHVGDLIRQRREELGLSRNEVAQAMGITAMAHHDLEAYEDELGSVIGLEEARRLAGKLSVPLGVLLAHLLDGLGTAPAQKELPPLGQWMSRFRMENGLSMADAAEAADIPKTDWVTIEGDETAVTRLPLGFIVAVAATVGMSRADLLAILDERAD